jgi:Holliday junction resolvasome RuvABC DNA-binding subunit
MKFGFSIWAGSWKFQVGIIGTPCCCLDERTSQRKPAPAKSVKTSAPASQLDPARQDAISALVALGFPKRQAQARIDAVTAGSTTEEILKAALRNGGGR